MPTQGQTDVQLTHELIYGESLLSYHAKSCRQNLKAESQLDIVPTQINSNTFTVLLRMLKSQSFPRNSG